MKKIEISFTQKGIEKFENILDEVEKKLISPEFKKYLADKCIVALKQICATNLTTYSKTDKDIDTSYYISQNKYKIEDDVIYVYNDSMIDVASKNMKETTKAKYPAQLSLAKIVEYGIGYTGASLTDQSQVEDWEYDVNGHGIQGWYYMDDSGNIHWTNGYEGRLIFTKLLDYVKLHIQEWILKYLEESIKD